MPAPQEIASIKRDHTLPLTLYSGHFVNPDEVLQGRGRGEYKAYDDLLKDGHTYSVLQKRYLAVVAREWKIEPASSSKVDKKAADMVKQHFTHLAARAEDEDVVAVGFDGLCYNLLDAILKGFKPAEILWQKEGSEVYPAQVKAKNQQRFRFGTSDKGKWELRLLTPDDMLHGEAVQKLHPKKFFAHSFGANDDNPYGVGLGRTIWWNVFFKKQDIKFWLHFVDKFASPTAIGKYPKGATIEQKNTLLAALDAIANDAGVIVPDGLEISLLEAARSGSISSYKDLASYMDSEISKAALGETLSTEMGDTGSYAAAQTHDKVRMQLSKADADLLSDTLNRTLIKWDVEYNLPGAKPPRLWRDFGEQENLDSRVQRDKTLFDMGWKLTKEAVTEIYGDGYEEQQQGEGEASDDQFLANSGVEGEPTEEEQPAEETPENLKYSEIFKDNQTTFIRLDTSQLAEVSDFKAALLEFEELASANALLNSPSSSFINKVLSQMPTINFLEDINYAAIGRRFVEIVRDLEFAESGTPVTSKEDLLVLRGILEETYTDGITAIKQARLDKNDNFTGIFEDAVSPALTKRYKFTITDDDVSYQLLNPDEADNFNEESLLEFSEQEWINFARSKMFGGTKNQVKDCKKGTKCGGTCIANGRKCHKEQSPAAKAKTKAVKEKVKRGTSSKAATATKVSNKTATPAVATKTSATKVDETKKPATKVDETKKPATKVDETKKPATKVDETKKPATKVDETKKPATKVDETKKPATKVDETKKPATNKVETKTTTAVKKTDKKTKEISAESLEAKGWGKSEAAIHAQTINESKKRDPKVGKLVEEALSQEKDHPNISPSRTGISSRITSMHNLMGTSKISSKYHISQIADAFGMAASSKNGKAEKALSVQLEQIYPRLSKTQKSVLAKRIERNLDEIKLDNRQVEPALKNMIEDMQKRNAITKKANNDAWDRKE